MFFLYTLNTYIVTIHTKLHTWLHKYMYHVHDMPAPAIQDAKQYKKNNSYFVKSNILYLCLNSLTELHNFMQVTISGLSQHWSLTAIMGWWTHNINSHHDLLYVSLATWDVNYSGVNYIVSVKICITVWQHTHTHALAYFCSSKECTTSCR